MSNSSLQSLASSHIPGDFQISPGGLAAIIDLANPRTCVVSLSCSSQQRKMSSMLPYSVTSLLCLLLALSSAQPDPANCPRHPNPEVPYIPLYQDDTIRIGAPMAWGKTRTLPDLASGEWDATYSSTSRPFCSFLLIPTDSSSSFLLFLRPSFLALYPLSLPRSGGFNFELRGMRETFLTFECDDLLLFLILPSFFIN